MLPAVSSPKKTITISVDVTAYEFHRRERHNISGLCNDYLKSLCFKNEQASPEQTQIKVLEGKMQKEKDKLKERAEIEAKEKVELKAALEAALRDAKKLRITGKDYGDAISLICEKYGISRAEAVSRIDHL